MIQHVLKRKVSEKIVLDSSLIYLVRTIIADAGAILTPTEHRSKF